MDSDYGPKPDIELWDELAEVFELFMRYSTQWRSGPGGLIGLDMTVFHFALERMGIKGDRFDEYVQYLGVIEAAAIQELHK